MDIEGIIILLSGCVGIAALFWGYQKFRSYVNDSAEKPDYNPYKTYYTVPMTSEALLSALDIPFFGISCPPLGTMSARYDRETGILRMENSLTGITESQFQLIIQDMDSFCIVTATPIIPALGRYYPTTVDRFMEQKFQAVKLNSRDIKPHA